MKKILIVAFFLALCSFAFAEKNEVFVLGLCQGEWTYVQVKSEKDTVSFTAKLADINFDNGIGGPVKNGSQFILVDFPDKKEKSFGLQSVIFEEDGTAIQSKKRRLTVTPNERGICFFLGSKDVYSDAELLEKYKKFGLFKKAAQKLLKQAIKEYAGTEWEEPLNEELEEWK